MVFTMFVALDLFRGKERGHAVAIVVATVRV
jgi:hypothetical protein